MASLHVQTRLAQRDIPFTESQLDSIAANYTQDTAVIIGRRISPEGQRYGYEKIILIVRDRKATTIMTRRESQNFFKNSFGVQAIAYA